MEEQPIFRERGRHWLLWVSALGFALWSLNASATPQTEGLGSDAGAPRVSAQPLPRSAWAEHSRAGREHLALGDLRNAEEAFLVALRVADEYPPRKQRLATSLSNLERLAALYQANGDSAGLARIGPHLVDAAARNHGGTDPAVIQHLQTLANAHKVNGDLDRARVVLLDTLTTQSARDGASAYSLVDTHMKLGSIALEQGDPLAAGSSFSRAQTIIESSRGTNDPAMATLLPLIARLRQQQGQNEEAEQAYLQSLDGLGEDPNWAPRRARNLHELANFYMEQERNEEAEVRLREALEITAGTPLPTRLQVGLLDSLARTLQRKGQYQQADLLFQEAKAFDPTGSNPAFDAVRAHHDDLIQTGKPSPPPPPAAPPVPEPEAVPEPSAEPTAATPAETPTESDDAAGTSAVEPNGPAATPPSSGTDDDQ